MKTRIAAAALAVSAAMIAAPAMPASEQGHVEDMSFSFEGPFGKFDQAQLQRGLQVFTEVCSACHGLRYVTFRSLGDTGGPHMPERQVEAYAKLFEVPDDSEEALPGDTRPGKPTDFFPVNDSVDAPDLSLMAKARAGFHGPLGTGMAQLLRGMGGPEYIVSLLNGYTGKEKVEAGVSLYENTAFPGGWISMAPPLEDGMVEYIDGHESDVHHMAEDVAAFLTWTAEPKLVARKQAGFIGVLMLLALTALLYLTNKRIWKRVKKAAGKP